MARLAERRGTRESTQTREGKKYGESKLGAREKRTKTEQRCRKLGRSATNNTRWLLGRRGRAAEEARRLQAASGDAVDTGAEASRLSHLSVACRGIRAQNSERILMLSRIAHPH